MTLLEACLNKNVGPGHLMVRLPCLFTGADCNVKASQATAEIADSVNVIGIVTSALCRNSVCTLALL